MIFSSIFGVAGFKEKILFKLYASIFDLILFKYEFVLLFVKCLTN